MPDISDFNTQGWSIDDIRAARVALARDNQRVEYRHRNDVWIIVGVVAFVGFWFVLAFLR